MFAIPFPVTLYNSGLTLYLSHRFKSSERVPLTAALLVIHATSTFLKNFGVHGTT